MGTDLVELAMVGTEQAGVATVGLAILAMG
jgi:hypothetical protein